MRISMSPQVHGCFTVGQISLKSGKHIFSFLLSSAIFLVVPCAYLFVLLIRINIVTVRIIHIEVKL